MTSLKLKFGKRVKELRKSVGITQEQMAEMIGIEPPNISKMENGMHFPQPDKIEKIAKALNVEIHELFNFEHLQDRQSLIRCINAEVESMSDRALQMVYNFIFGLKLYK